MSGINNIGGICRDCTDRTLTCHDTCEKYIAAKAEYEAVKRKIAEERRTSYFTGQNAEFRQWRGVPRPRYRERDGEW